MSPCACNRKRKKDRAPLKRTERKGSEEAKDSGKAKGYTLRSSAGSRSFSTRLEAEAARRRAGGGTIHPG